ncbi:MAG: histidine kinase, partial [Pseudomonadota bacterium]
MIGLVAAWALIGLIASQVNLGVERELGRLEGTLSDAMRRLLESEARLLRGAFEGVDPAAPQDMRETLARLSESNQGPDQHLFVYHQDGTTLVSPGLTTAAQRPGLSEILRAGSGFHKALVRGPDGAPEAPMLIYIDAGNGAPLTLGVGRFSDAITDRLSEARAELEAEARRSVRLMGAAVAGILMALSWYWVARAGRERRLAEGKIRHLTERAVHAQEDERGRISRELHDTVGQRLITARHALDLARRRL